MNWVKKGLVIHPGSNFWWNRSHAMVPTVDSVVGNSVKVYYSGRDSDGVSHIGYSRLEINNGELKEVDSSSEPVFTIGARGCFDDNGVTPSCIVDTPDRKLMYYIGWNSGNSTVRFSLIAGLAQSFDGGESFTRVSEGPILHRSNLEPLNILTGPHVLQLEDKWWMWYVSGIQWVNKDLPRYNIKIAYSDDGIEWNQKGEVAIDLEHEEETALARPFVCHDDGKFLMYFSYKDPKIGYRIAHAESVDGKTWQRKNSPSVIDIGETGWDSEMVEYTSLFRHNGFEYMLYNGNGYGSSGIGYAVRSI